MKKLILTCLIAAGAISAVNAQDKGLQGTWFAGGQLAFGTTNNNNTKEKTTSTTVLPIVGSFIAPSVAIGVGVGYIGETAKVDGEKIGSADLFVIKPLVRKYWNVSGGLFFFGQAALPVLFGTTKVYNIPVIGEAKATSTSVALQLAPGFDYVINKWLTIETSFDIFSVGFDSSKPDGGKSSSDFSFNANPFNSISDRTVGNLQVGVKFLF
jgi:hypothetical protein